MTLSLLLITCTNFSDVANVIIAKISTRKIRFYSQVLAILGVAQIFA